MVKLTSPLLSLGAVGRFAKHFSLRRSRKVNILEACPIPTDAKSPNQLFYRSMFTLCKEVWLSLSDAAQAEWESIARPKHMTGYNWFMSQCLKPNPGIYLPLVGGTMSGNIDMATNRILDLLDPILAQEAATKAYADTHGYSDAEADARIAIHALLAAAHHARYTNAEADARIALAVLNALADLDVAAPADDDVLYWDDAAGKWKSKAPAAPGAGQNSVLNYRKVGAYHLPAFAYSKSNAPAMTSDYLYATPFYVPGTFTADRIAINVTAAFAGNCRLGIYDDDAIYPGNLIDDCGEVSHATTGIKEIIINEALTAGLYWTVIAADTGFTISGNLAAGGVPSVMGLAAINVNPENHLKVAHVYGALPDPFPGGATPISTPFPPTVYLRKA